MADKEDLTPAGNSEVLIAQAQEKPETSKPRRNPNIRVVPNVRAVPNPPPSAVPQLPVAPLIKPSVIIPVGASILRKALPPLLIYDIFQELFVTTQPAGPVRAAQQAREESAIRLEKAREERRRLEAEKPQPQNPQNNQKPPKTQPQPPQSQSNPEPPISPTTPIPTPGPYIDRSPNPVAPPTTPREPQFNVNENLEERDRETRRQENERDNRRAAEIEKEKKDRAEADKRNRRAQQRSNQNFEIDQAVNRNSVEEESLIYAEFERQKQNALQAAADLDDQSDINSQDNVRRVGAIWDKRREKLDNVYKQRNSALDKWQNPSAPTGVLVDATAYPDRPAHKWLDTEGKKYHRRAKQMLRDWSKQDQKKTEPAKKPTPPQTAEQINKKKQQGRARGNQQANPSGTNASATPTPQKPSQNTGQKPSKKDKGGRPRWDQAADEIGKTLPVNSLEFKELGKNLDKLKAKGLTPELVVKLNKQGIKPSQLNEYLDEISSLESGLRGTPVHPEHQEVANLTSKLIDQLPNTENRTKIAKNIIQNSTASGGSYKYTKEIINSGKLRNPEKLKDILNNYRTNNDQGSLGNLFALELAARAVRSGSEISLEAGGDVVDHTNKRVWQAKNVDGDDSLSGNLNKAAEQLTGASGEVPPPGYTRGIAIKITNPNNPDYKKTPKELEKSITDSISTNTGNKWDKVNQVQITIGDKTHVFKIKRVGNLILPSYQRTYSSGGYSVSEIDPGVRVAENGFSQLLSSLNNYQQVLNTSDSDSISTMSSTNTVMDNNSNINQRLSKIGQDIQQLSADALQNIAQAAQEREQALQATNSRSSRRDFGMGGIG
jgi:hypothetical protein